MRIWIDTDIGSDVDDALALAYVLRHPGFELVGISTVFGDIELRTRIAEELLSIAGPNDVPVLPGLGVPLSPGKRGIMFGHEGLGLFDDANPELRRAEEDGGPARIAALASAITDAAPDVVLAIGPLTNLGALAEQGFSFPPLAIMGGKFTDAQLPGMTDRISEWNWFCDPRAVQLVLQAPHKTLPLVVPAEVTFQTKLRPGDPELLTKGDELAQAIGSLSNQWLRAQRDLFNLERQAVALHDPLAAALLVEPTLCATKPLLVEVADDGSSTVNTSNLATGHADNLITAVDVDAPALRDHLMATWLA